MRRDVVVRDRVDIAVGALSKIGFVSGPGLIVPVGRENAPTTCLFKGNAESADTTEQIDKLFGRAGHVRTTLLWIRQTVGELVQRIMWVIRRKRLATRALPTVSSD